MSRSRREKAFLCILSLKYLTLKSFDVDERVVYVRMFEVLVKKFYDVGKGTVVMNIEH